MYENYLILIHAKRTDKAIIPRIIQYASFLQILNERVCDAGIKKSFIAAKTYNVNHTALVYYENGAYRVFQANRVNNVHTLLLSDYIANTKAEIYCSIHCDAEYTLQQKRALKKYISFYCSTVKYNVMLAFLAWRPVKQLFGLFFKRKNIYKYTLCSDIVIRLFEKVFKKEIKDFLQTRDIAFFADNHSNAPWRIWYAVNCKKSHNYANNLTNTKILDKQEIINKLLK
tara:strand:- start:185 stop:868 length:684 start_codon:yes stop_codon:yes gene_type:complete